MRRHWRIAALSALLGACLAAATLPQEKEGDRWMVRVHLKNGSILEGDLVRQAGDRLVLVMGQGEVSLRRDSVARVEQVRIRSAPAPIPPAPPPRAKPPEAPGESSASLRERADRILASSRRATDDGRRELARELASLGPRALPHLIGRYEFLDGPTRAMVAGILIDAGAALAPSALEPLVRAGASGIRAEGAQILGALGNPGGASLLERLLRDLHPTVRAAAVQGLVALGTREAFRILSPACCDSDREVRLQALRSLPQLAERNDCREALDAALLEAMERTSGEARADVVSVMGVTGRERLGRYLADALRDDSALVRAAAVTALMNLGPNAWKESLLDRFFREEDSAVRTALAAAAPQLRSQEAIDPLIAWLAGPDRNVAQAALRALKILTARDFGADSAAWTAWWNATRPK